MKLPTLRHNYTYSCIRVVPHTHSHLEEHVQGDDSLPQCLTEVVDGVIDGILLSIQVEDPVWTAGGEAVSIRCCDDGLNYYLYQTTNSNIVCLIRNSLGAALVIDHPSLNFLPLPSLLASTPSPSPSTH